MSIFTADKFCEKLIDATGYRTLYVMGCFGAPMNDANKERYCNNNPYNKKPERTAMIKNATSSTFGFDCVCLIKGILWGWKADTKAQYGGAKYSSNDVPDVGTEEMLNYCTDVSGDMSTVTKGEYLWMNGHCGIYIGDGKVVECTPAWSNGVQITRLYQRQWLKHGKLKWIDYKPQVQPRPNTMLSVGDQITTIRDYKVYSTAADAIAKKPSNITYKKGQYYVYKIYFDNKGNLSYNISRKKNSAGGWVVL